MKNLKIYLAGVLTAVLAFCLIGSASASVGKVTRELEYRNIKVSLNGEILDLRNAQGEPVEPFMFGGTNYLPVRALAEALGLRVSWDSPSATVVLTTPDAGTAPAAGAAAAPSYLAKEDAEAAALKHAGVSRSDAAFLRVELDRENGRTVYDVEFRAGETKYDYDVDALTGEILSSERETVNRTAAAPAAENAAQSEYIGAEKAKSIALSHAGLTASGVTRLKAELDRDHGRMEYEVEFRVGNKEYNYDIDAVTGSILKHETETDDD